MPPQAPASETDSYRIIRTIEGQYGVWPARDRVPQGWTDSGFVASRQRCLAVLQRKWGHTLTDVVDPGGAS